MPRDAQGEYRSTSYYRVEDPVPSKYVAHFETARVASLDIKAIEVPGAG